MNSTDTVAIDPERLEFLEGLEVLVRIYRDSQYGLSIVSQLDAHAALCDAVADQPYGGLTVTTERRSRRQAADAAAYRKLAPALQAWVAHIAATDHQMCAADAMLALAALDTPAYDTAGGA